MRNNVTSWLSMFMLSILFVVAQSSSAQTITLPDFVTLAEDYSPSVVRIEAEGEPNLRQQQQMEQWQQQMPEMFRYFFGDQMPSQPNQPPQPQPRRSQGSGFIISSDGYVVTNHHVIAGANSVRVRLDDQRSFAAEVIGTD